MAIAAFHQPFVNAVMEGHGEFRLFLKVAAVAKSRFLGFQQLRCRCRMVCGMAIKTSNIIFLVLRAKEVGMFFSQLMTGKTALARLFALQLGERDDFRNVSTGINVCLAWPMARFTAG